MHFSAPTLTVNLDAIVTNWQWLRSRFTGEECGAVVKADAYGLGVERVARALADAGCNSFFVATLEEGIALRAILPNRRIAVFHGVQEGEALALVNHRLIPCLNSPEQIIRWSEIAREHRDAQSILHLDTAMARLGLTLKEFDALDDTIIEECNIAAIMSHLACASEPEHPSNAMQRATLKHASMRFPTLPVSFCNSGGILLDASFHCDLARPGCALYGINPHHGDSHPQLEHVATLSAPILQIRQIDAAQTVGYGATQTMPAGSKLATIGLGYADGIPRSLSGKLHGYIGECNVPLAGRVTMDMLTFDVSDIKEDALNNTAYIDIICNMHPVDAFATQADTIGYEVFARLGSRVKRVYSEGVL